MNDVNPYQPPPIDRENKAAADPLRFPAIGFSVFGALALVLGSSIFVLGGMILWKFRDIIDSEDAANVYRRFGPATWIVSLSLLSFLCSYCLFKRKWRWYVIAFSLLTFLPFTGFVMIPLGVLTLVRLRQKEVWESFQAGSRQGLSSE